MAEIKKKKSSMLDELTSPFKTTFEDDKELDTADPFEDGEEVALPPVDEEMSTVEEKEDEVAPPVGIGPTPERIYEAPAEEEAEVTTPAGEEDEDESQVTETLSVFKEIPNPLDLAKERDLVSEEFLNELAAAKETYNQTKDEVARKKLWDGIITGMANIAAGLYGIQTGIDLSGVKFDVTDWSDDLNQATSDLSAARALAKDVRDVKMSALDEKRDQRLREIQSIRQLNADAIDRLELERRNRKEENAKIQAMLEPIAEQNLAVEDKIAGTELYKSYKDDEKRLEGLYNKLPGMKSSDRKETIQIMRDISASMQGKVDKINSRLGEGEQFFNRYPQEVFAPAKGMFGRSIEPDVSDLSERGLMLSKQRAEGGDIKSQALQRAQAANMDSRDLRVYENYLNDPGSYDETEIEKLLKKYGLLK